MIARGHVVSTNGNVAEIEIPNARVGENVAIAREGRVASGTIRSLGGRRALVAIDGAFDGIVAGTRVTASGAPVAMPLGVAALARAFDADGEALDGGGPLCGIATPVRSHAPLPLRRSPIVAPLWTGVRAVDALLAFGRGARVGVFGAPGTGKSTLLESLVRGCRADAIVVALVGERGREAQRWIEAIDARTTVVVATSDRSPGERVRAAYVAAAQAGALRRRGLHVVWLLDSLARFAQALREVALAAGEPAGRGGYPPGVFAEIARLVEIAGPLRGSGSITLIASVLDDGDDRDPVSDAARSLLDGHLALSAPIAARGRFPAIDVTRSASRTMHGVVTARHYAAACRMRAALAFLDRTQDARALGIVPAGAGAIRAVGLAEEIERFLGQGAQPCPPQHTLARLIELADTLEEPDGYQ